MVLGKVRNQRGAGSIGCLFMLALIAAAMYAGFMLAIPRLRHGSFEDRISETYAGGFQQQTPEEIQKQLIQIASDFDIELTPAQVKVDTTGGRLRIDIKYEKFVDLKVWQTTLPFSVKRNPAP